MTTKRALFLVMVAGLTACAAPAPAQDATPQPTISVEPDRPPLDPTDRIKDTSWVVGTVTADSSGPCYHLTTDDGTRYALHSTDGTKLVKGVRMRIRTEHAKVPADCGAGKLVEMVAAEPLR
ncbi:hypothetical protein HH310_24820 [Actinoplanes sp. TBRC 11911]|uniref:hypothetical protein n=1 Tax=Actinoplanes sp. TBRC 11911 TaxID=2729386 RepID=UPI00145FA533|nr:hypothetical protein [Actinoplanes sp. TBRC 11911]NMO54394.1 hypothetical protein [Actinoplanes sp. TBRC 11911]